MRVFVLAALLMSTVMASVCCTPPPPPQKMCDYCKVPRLERDVKLYSCRKCKQSHWSCSLEKPLHAMEVSKGQKEGEVGAALGYSIKSCPQ